MEYTAEQFSEATRDRVDINSGVVNLSSIEFNEGYSIFINNNIIVISEDSGDTWMETKIIQVKDISNIALSDYDSVIVATPLETFYIYTKGSSQELALALISVLSPV